MNFEVITFELSALPHFSSTDLPTLFESSWFSQGGTELDAEPLAHLLCSPPARKGQKTQNKAVNKFNK